ncbi:unnamed protein product [Ambrosiozyma monospora]|uniref:Unnamed protein product n=1 Tax=Ambrosiozyma monospora TaxID=43982 RepID=A0ACB5SSD5_AMBMO|nr:unnamed protein product [Ambrosiozyma monospora]
MLKLSIEISSWAQDVTSQGLSSLTDLIFNNKDMLTVSITIRGDSPSASVSSFYLKLFKQCDHVTVWTNRRDRDTSDNSKWINDIYNLNRLRIWFDKTHKFKLDLDLMNMHLLKELTLKDYPVNASFF